MIFDDVVEGYTFDDFSLVPAYSEISSRKDPDISSELVPGLRYDTPIISANMSKVTEVDMIRCMLEMGGTGAFHRFVTVQELEHLLIDLCKNGQRRFGISVGVDPEYYGRILDYVIKGPLEQSISYIIVDVAHGHHKFVERTIKDLKNRCAFPIIAGNVCTAKGVIDLARWGADAAKTGVSPGSACSTRQNMGVGYPQLSAISNAHRARLENDLNIRIIADGGMRHTGDMVKALAAGADFLMTGNMLAGCSETPGNVLTTGDQKFKLYEGMASIDAQATFFSKESEDIVPEGEAFLVDYKGSAKKVLSKMIGSIKTGLSYLGCNNIQELHEHASDPEAWVKITYAGHIEGTPHGMRWRS